MERSRWWFSNQGFAKWWQWSPQQKTRSRKLLDLSLWAELLIGRFHPNI